ncbi:MAG: type I DNA topoisomerase [candidate division SR1 bacterium]|nr:type I DNA topoisomerase [candidate division SR1 bacterium]
MKHLVIVESPAKSATIKKFLGEGFEVKASFGHVIDLPQKELGVDVKNNFAPKYQVSPDKTKVVSELKALAKKADKVWIATDEDREGEAIGRHVANALGLDIKKTARIVFHEITKEAIDKAVKNPRAIDMNLVDAQQARRVLDRLVGFELSPVLWKKIKMGLSAGRVQSVAVRLIVEREREIQRFESASFFKVIGNFVGDVKKEFKAELSKDLPSADEAKKFLESCKDAKYTIESVEVKPGKKSPSAPFTTSTIQQEASRKLGFSVARTMQVAQKLYEGGFITYMRTDSVNLSEFAVKAAQDEIVKRYGKDYSKPTQYVTKSKGSQEAHECIRPTHMENNMAGGDASEKKLYELIWKRTIASQMARAEVEKTKATISISTNTKFNFIASGEVIKFEGFLKVYLESKDEEEDDEESGMLPKLTKGEMLTMQQILATERFKNHPPRYTEASLVKKLEELGIGRPSTYAPTISTVQKRGYVVKEDRNGSERKFQEFTLRLGVIKAEVNKQNTGAEKQKLFPTDIGMVVNDFLVANFKDILDYNFTASVEEEFDEIAEGKIKRTEMMKKFYGPFHKEVAKTIEFAEKQTGEKDLGIDPKTGKKVVARIGRFGPMVQIGTAQDEDKPKFASLRPGQNIELLTLEDALALFALPRIIGEYQGEGVTAAVGKFGPYLKYKTLFVSLPKTLDPYTVTMEEAAPLIEKKIDTEKNKYISEFDHEGKKIEVLNGLYGAYLKYDGNNYKIPKGGKDATDLTKKDCLEIIAAGPRPSRFGNKKEAAKPAKASKETAKKASAKKVNKAVKSLESKPVKKTSKKK